MVSGELGIFQDATHEISLRAVPVLVGAILFGIFTLLFALSSYLLIKRGIRVGGGKFMLVATTFMYASAAAYLLLDFLSFFNTARDPDAHVATSPAAVKTQSVLLTAFLGINFILSDAIVLWRATIFWNEKRIVKTISLVLFVVILVLGVVDLATDRGYLNPIAGDQPTRLIPRAKVNIPGIASMLSSTLANFWATSLMAARAWHFRKVMASTGFRGGAPLLFWKFLRMLLICSIVYCCFWIIFVAVAVVPTHTDSMITLGFGFSNAIVQVIGIYPTVIVVIVSMEYLQTSAQADVELQRANVLMSNGGASMELTQLSWRPTNGLQTERTEASGDGTCPKDDHHLVEEHPDKQARPAQEPLLTVRARTLS